MTPKPLYMRVRHKRAAHWKFAVPGLFILFGTVGGALAWNFYYGFTRWSGFGTPTWVGWRNYIFIFKGPEVVQTVQHALWDIIPFSIIPTLLGAFVAALLFEYISPRFGAALASMFRGFLYLPQIIPLAMTGVIWNWILNAKEGLLNQYFENAGLHYHIRWLQDPFTTQVIFFFILIWLQLGFTLIIFLSGMARIDTSILEAAQLDGASWFQQFRHITIPSLRPEMAVVVLTTTINSLKIFAPVYWITRGGPYGSTSVPSTYVFNQFYGGNQVGRAAAIAAFFACIVSIFTALVMRYQRKNSLVRV